MYKVSEVNSGSLGGAGTSDGAEGSSAWTSSMGWGAASSAIMKYDFDVSAYLSV
jgi:hypothetical protein